MPSLQLEVAPVVSALELLELEASSVLSVLVDDVEVGVGSSLSVVVVVGGASGAVEAPPVLVATTASLVAVPVSLHARQATAVRFRNGRRVGLELNTELLAVVHRVCRQ